LIRACGRWRPPPWKAGSASVCPTLSEREREVYALVARLLLSAASGGLAWYIDRRVRHGVSQRAIIAALVAWARGYGINL